MKLVEVKETQAGKYFTEFYNHSVFTFEGFDIFDERSINLLEQQLRERGFRGEPVGYYYYGKSMNTVFGLTQSNAYPDDLMFLSIPNFYDPMFKLVVKARWFDDIVSNNTIRQNAINAGIEADYGEEEVEIDEYIEESDTIF